MYDWLTVTGLTFGPILAELAKEAGKDWAVDFSKKALTSVLAGRDPWAKAVGKAFKEFLAEFEGELVGTGESEETAQRYLDSLREFTRKPEARQALGAAICVRITG